MKKQGYEVTGRRPVCVDFQDKRSVSFAPGMRFEAHPSNPGVVRGLRARVLRKLGLREVVPPQVVKLGVSPRLRRKLAAQAQIDAARASAQAKMRVSKDAPPVVEMPKQPPTAKK